MAKTRESTVEETSASCTEALLLSTMNIIGLPVEVHVKDGSIFSGIFHSATVDEGYGIVLKKASLVRKGTLHSNMSDGGLIDTLVVQPEDLVQVVAKGVTVPDGNISSWPTSVDREAVSGTVGSCQTSEIGDVSAAEQRRENVSGTVGSCKTSEIGDVSAAEQRRETVSGTVGSCQTSEIGDVSAAEQRNQERVKTSSDSWHQVDFLQKTTASEVSGSAKTQSVVSPNSLAVPAEMTQNPLTNTAQESKLNPSAKNFSPSISNRSVPTPVPPRAAYEPDSIPTVQVAGAQPEVGIRPNVSLPSWPFGFVPYAASTKMNADSLQYNQPIGGHIFPRAQPIGHGGQYQPVQALPPYLHLDPHNGMFGRNVQLVYVHPFTHDAFQASAPRPQIPHPFLTSHGVAMNEGILGGPPSPASMAALMVNDRPQPSTMRGDIHPPSMRGNIYPPSLQPRSSRSSVSTRGFTRMRSEFQILFCQRGSSRSRFPTRGFNILIDDSA